MSIQRIESAEVVERSLELLDVDGNGVDLFSTEGVCASLRRAASLLCPASPQRLVDAVLEVLAPLDSGLQRDVVADALDALVSLGDLLELRQPGARTRELFLGPPSYVEKHPGEYLILGIRPRAAKLIDEEATGSEIRYEAHTRSLTLEPSLTSALLDASGLHRLTREQWARAPRALTPQSLIQDMKQRLRAARAPGQVAGLSVIDPTASVRFYKGRWREPMASDKGLFVGRRPQAYGAPMWCAVELSGGVPQAVMDLPVESSLAPGWDEARRLQAALDAEAGAPQVYRIVASGLPDQILLDFFGPLPSWADRYLALVGMPVIKTRGALFSYRMPQAVLSDVKEFLSISLWMTATEEEMPI